MNNYNASVSTWTLTKYGYRSINEVFDAALSVGIKYFDLTLDDYNDKYGKYYSMKEQQVFSHFSSVKKEADERGAIVFQTHAPFVGFPAFLKKDFFDLCVKSIAATAAVGAKYCVFHSQVFPLYGKNELSEQEYDFNMNFFGDLQPYLKKYGVTACLENLYDWDKGDIREIYVSQPLNLCRYIDSLGKNFAACLDTGHAHLFNIPINEAVSVLGDRLKVLHVHDNDGIKDNHFIPYEGNIDWTGFSDGLRKNNYSGTINLELKPTPIIVHSIYALSLAKKIAEESL